MSSERANPFADLDLPQFTTKQRTQSQTDPATIEQIARDQNFPSRQPHVESGPGRRRRVYTTGRNQQLNFKVTAATADRFYAMADRHGVKLCELLEQALDALEHADKQGQVGQATATSRA